MATQNTLTKEATITQLFGDVERFVNQGDYSKAFKPIDKILQLNPNDYEALQCKAITYIRLEKYQNALDVLNKNFPSDKFILERAYCLYRLNQFSEVTEFLRKCRVDGHSNLGTRYLEAQVAYKVEDYNTALEIYYGLLQETDKNDDTYNDILTNFNAAKAALLFSGNNISEKYVMVDSLSTYELAYNSACVHIGQRNLKKAEKMLLTARRICKESLFEEDYSEQEIEQELGTINVQLAYVLQLQGQISEAIDIYQSVLKSKGVDMTVSAIASNNLVAAKKDTELFDSVRKIKVASANTLENKLFRSQRRIIAMNEALLSLYMHKEAVRKMLQVYPENDDLYLILASTSYHQKKNAKAIQDLLEFAKSKPHSLSINFALMQLQILQSNPLAALETFETHLSSINDEKEKYKPGYVGLLVWLYEQAGKQEKAVKALEKAGAFWKRGVTSDGSTSILKQTAAFKLKIGRYREAAQDYEQIVKSDPLDSQALAGLVAAYSQYDISLAEKYESSLLDIGTPMDIDVESLEKVVPGVKKSYIKKTDTKTSEGPTKRTPRKKKRKPLLPKNHDPSVSPDPERWLPKRERSTYKVKGKRKQQLSKGSQGIAIAGGGTGGTGSANIFGRSASNLLPPETVVTSSTAQQEQPLQKPKSGGGDKNKKKKKKGGNKW
ncbi:9751_t:CDS:10 [Acaulospora morrowiae]|uniref:Signal recognition particle subunit SRP72 n=1 Tax=Acaulospora morrowiae TaxID=94023 RepID=A0A9N9BFL3_9GLOM|nr:9751_t:CDS:10 [Acaulospora morrowiae]